MTTKKQKILTPIQKQADVFSGLFAYLNKELFDSKLDDTMLIFSRNKQICGGFFTANSWLTEDGEKLHEIALNANIMKNSDIPHIVNIITHEMAHLWHFQETKKATAYHDTKWVNKCLEIGLQPMSNDKDRKNGTGYSVHTEIIPDGKFETVLYDMPDELLFPYFAEISQSDEDGGDGDKEEKKDEKEKEQPKKRAGVKVKYTCPICGAALWGKAGLSVICGDCQQPFVEQVK